MNIIFMVKNPLERCHGNDYSAKFKASENWSSDRYTT